MDLEFAHALLSVIRAEMVAIVVLWGKVLYHYGRAARAEWIQQGGGGKRKLFWELVHPFSWAWRQQLSQWGLMKPNPKSAFETYTPYTPGVILRFAIWAAAVAPAMAFFRFFTPPYNPPVAQVSGWHLGLSIIIFAFSILGALAHLYVAHRTNPKRWMYIGFWSTIWILIGPLLFWTLWPPPVPATVLAPASLTLSVP